MNNPTEEAAPGPYAWILHPVIDMLFCCGGLVWIFFGIHYFLIGPQSQSPAAQTLIIVVIVITHLFSNPHTAATLVRVYKNHETRAQFSFCTYWVAGACALLAFIGFSVQGAAPIFLKIYVLWVIQHYTSQSYGIALIYCYKRGYHMNAFEKRVLWLLMYGTAFFAIIRQFTYPLWGSQVFIFHQLPFWGPIPEWIFHGSVAVLIGSVILFTGVVVRKAIIERKFFPFPAFFLTATGILIHVFGGTFSATLWLYVPAFYHGSQYIVVTTAYYLKERGLPEGISPNRIASALMQSMCLRYLGLLLVAGAFIYIGLPRFFQEVGFSYPMVFATIFSVFNFHHFVTDHAIWRLRDPKIRQTLVA